MLIECKKGYSKNDVLGRTYIFNRDKYGRFVAQVRKIEHQSLFLSQPRVFQEVPETPEEDLDEAEAVETGNDDKSPEATKEPVYGDTKPGAEDGEAVKEPGAAVKPGTEASDEQATATEAEKDEAPKDIDAMNRDELKAYATSLGIEFNARIKTDKLIDLILESEDGEDEA